MSDSYASCFPVDMEDYFNSRWIPKQLWELQLPVTTLDITAVEWHLDYPFWPSEPPDHIFDLRPRDVLNKPALYQDHYQRILSADVSYPIDLGVFGSTIVILDGIHRLAKLVRDGATEVDARHVPNEHITRLGG